MYVLVAVRAPDHHGLGVGDLAGGDGDGLGDLSLLGDSGHDDYSFVSKSDEGFAVGVGVGVGSSLI